MRLRNLLDLDELRLTLIAGHEELDRPIRWVVTTDMPDPSRYLAGEELVLTGLVWRRDPADSEAFVAALAKAGVSGLAAGDAAFGAAPPDLIEACRRHRLPLFAVPVDVAFATVTEAVVRRLSAQRAGDLATVLDRHRRLLSAGADGGGGLDAVLELVVRDLGLDCWVLSPTGRCVAGPPTLSPALELRLAREFLHADRLPGSVTLTTGQVFTVLPVTPGGGHRIADWCLAVESDSARWPPERWRLVDELVALVGAERDQLARRLHHPLAAEVIELITTGAEVPAFLPQLRSCGLTADGAHLVVVAAVPGAAGLAPAVLEELIRPHAVLAPTPQGAAALIPLTGEPVDQQARELIERIQTAAHALEPGLGGLRLLLGISGVATGAAGLHGAAEEARYASQLAALRPGRAVVVGDDQLSSHLLLLAGIPDDLRRTFRSRVLGPLHEYDREHRSDLVPTLRAFLDCSGSWTRCAEQLHVHVNTLRYRIRRIEQLTGRDLSTLPDRVDLYLALRLD